MEKDKDNTRYSACCGVVELRQYTMQPGQRDTLIAIFERHFIEAQEDVGMTIVGQFRDRARADRFVFIRGFADMASRHTALEQFYSGDVWAEQSEAANATMIDWHDVLLLRPARRDTMFDVRVSERPARDDAHTAAPASSPRPTTVPAIASPTATASPTTTAAAPTTAAAITTAAAPTTAAATTTTVTSTIFAGIHGLRVPADDATVGVFERHAVPVLRAQGVRVDALLVTEPAPNTFTRLPVREGEHVLVWVGTHERQREREHGEVSVTRDIGNVTIEATRDTLTAALGRVADLTAFARDFEPLIVLELEPTSRSLLGHQRARAIAEQLGR